MDAIEVDALLQIVGEDQRHPRWKWLFKAANDRLDEIEEECEPEEVKQTRKEREIAERESREAAEAEAIAQREKEEEAAQKIAQNQEHLDGRDDPSPANKTVERRA